MWKYYLKSGWRSVKKGKIYSVLNIAGLAIGLAAGIMLLLWVQNESAFDRSLDHADHIFRINTHFKGQQNAGRDIVYDKTPGKIYAAAKSIPEISTVTRLLNDGDGAFTQPGQHKPFELSTLFVDDSFLSVFSFKLVAGDSKKLWNLENSVVLTAAAAKRIFGAENAVGQVLQFEGHAMTVSGVMADFGNHSSIKADVLLPMDYYAKGFRLKHHKSLDDDRQSFGMETFVLLHDEGDSKKVANKFTKTWTDLGDKRFEFQLQHLTSIHLVQPNGENSAYRLVQIFMAIVVMLFLIASINYVNISTARSLARAKEVGIKKIMGATRGQLFKQFFWETALIFGISLVIAIGLIFALMPLYNYIAGQQLYFAIGDWQIWRVLVLVLLATLALSSIYPALLLSSFKPLNALRSKVGKHLSANSFRRALVVFQFFMAAVLLFMTIVMGKQLDYIRQLNIGYDKDYVFSVPFPDAAIGHMEDIEYRLSQNNSIRSTGLSNAENLTDLYVSSTGLHWQGKDPNSTFFIYSVAVDHRFIPAMKMQLVEGHNFIGRPSDSTGVILNQTALKDMELQAPYVGQQVSLGAKKCTIIGVVKDFNFQSLKSEISPLVFYVNPASTNILYVRTSARDMTAAIAAVRDAFEPYKTNENPYNYHFIDKQFESLYKADMRVGALFITFSSIAILISCLGLFGLATFNAECRIREMGIRKVLGATMYSIVGLICKEFVLLVLLATLISAPISYWLAGKWLHNFAYPTAIGLGVFFQVFFILVLITFMTISLKVYRTAKSNLLPHLKSD